MTFQTADDTKIWNRCELFRSELPCSSWVWVVGWQNPPSALIVSFPPFQMSQIFFCQPSGTGCNYKTCSSSRKHVRAKTLLQVLERPFFSWAAFKKRCVLNGIKFSFKTHLVNLAFLISWIRQLCTTPRAVVRQVVVFLEKGAELQLAWPCWQKEFLSRL